MDFVGDFRAAMIAIAAAADLREFPQCVQLRIIESPPRAPPEIA